MELIFSALSAFANVAAVITAVVAVWFFWTSRTRKKQHTTKLEEYLEMKHGMYPSSAGLAECAAVLGTTESEVMEAAVASKVILRGWRTPDNYGPDVVVLEYDSPLKPAPVRRRRVSPG